ncbi:MAG: hypothetical protein ABIF82_11960 [Planctomycetota bacterium]
MSARAGTRGSAKLALAAGSAVIVAVGGIGAWLFGSDAPSPKQAGTAPTYEVRRGNLRITVKRKGTFEAEQATPVKALIRGSAKVMWLEEKGTTVKKGAVLVELDKTELEDQIEIYTSQVVEAEANLLAAQTDEEITRLDAQSKIDAAKLDYDMAELEIEKFEKGIKPKEVRDATIKIDQAKVTLLRVTAVDARMPEMLKEGFVTKEEVEQSRLDVLTAKNAFGTAELEYEILTRYTHPMQSERLAGNTKQAKSLWERYEQEAKRRDAKAKAVTAQRELELGRAKRQLKESEERLGNMTIKAETDGIVVYGSGHRSRWRAEEELKVGATAFNNQILMRLPNLNTMQLICEVHEADINRIRVDKENPQEAVITIENMPGKVFPAYVKEIDTLAQSHWYKENVKFFLTTIGLKKQIPDLRPGTTATVDIFVGRVDNVLLVPVQSVTTVRGKSYCYMAGSEERREVVKGANNNAFVEIKSGLKEGEVILLERPAGAADEPAVEKKPPVEQTPQVPDTPAPRGRSRGKGTR